MVALRELIKNKKLVRQISLACILVGACEAHAQDSKLSVDNPFATQLTHDNMSKCDDSYSQYYSALLRITSYSYVFLPPDGGTGKRNGPNVEETRIISFSIPEISGSKIYALLHSMDQDSCDTNIQVSNTSFTIPDPSTAAVSYHFHGGFYDCGWILGIHYKNWVQSVDADVRVEYGFNDQLELVPKGPAQISQLHQTGPMMLF